MNTEVIILSHLLHDEQYTRRVMPYLKPEYFSDLGERTVFQKIRGFVDEYNDIPTRDVIRVALQKDSSLTQDLFDETIELVDHLEPSEKINEDWLLSETEDFCRKKAVRLAIIESMTILDGKSRELSTDAIPQLLQDALAISFETSIGHDYTEDAESRFDDRQRVVDRLPFSVDMLNTITRGGLPKKTLNVIMAGVGVGKTIFMCDLAASAFTAGKNVLYITMEMSREAIAERIDANLLGVPVENLPLMDREVFKKNIAYIKSKTVGRLFIQEYPTGEGNANHFLALCKELEAKKNFRPDLIVVDYLNICASARYKKTDDKYGSVKSVAEELRGLGMKLDVPVFSATQLTRGGFASSDAEMTDVAESWGVPATADLFLLMMTNEDLEEKGQVLFKQLKNRYRDVSKDKRFLVGLNKDEMRFFNLDLGAQATMARSTANLTDASDSAPIKKFFTSGKKFTPAPLDLDDS